MRFFDAIGDKEFTIQDPIKKKTALYFCQEEDEESLLNQPQFINRYKVDGKIANIFIFNFRKRAS